MLLQALEELAAWQGIMPFERFRLNAMMEFERTIPPLAVALLAGGLFELVGVPGWFDPYRALYWGGCAAYFFGALALEKYNERIRVEAYELYLWRFDEAALRACYSHPLAMGREFNRKVDSLMKRHIEKRFGI